MAALIRSVVMATLCLLLAGPCFAAGQQGISKGFGSVAWGEDVSKHPGFMKLRTDEGITYFVNLRERYEMKGYGKTTVFYGQAGDRLYAVHLRLSESTEFDRLASELRRLYGPGKKSAEDGLAVMRWKKGPVRIKLKQAQTGMKLSFYYQPVAITLPAAQQEAEPSARELSKLLPSGETPVTVPPGAVPPPQQVQEGIDVLKFLQQGGKMLKPAIRPGRSQ